MRRRKGKSRPLRVALTAAAIAGVTLCGAVFASLGSSARVHPEWKPGHQALYRFEYRGEAVYQLALIFSPNAAKGAPQRAFTDVSGTLTATTVSRDAHGAVVVWNIVDPQVHYTTGASLDPIYAAQLRLDVMLPYAMHIENDGRVDSFAASSDASQLGVQFMRAVLGRIQVVAAAAPSPFARTWTASEPDADGTRTSTYTVGRWISDPIGTPALSFTRATSVTVTYPQTSVQHRPDILGAGEDRGVWLLDGSLEALTSSDARNTYYGQSLIARAQSALGLRLAASATLDDKKLAASRAFAERRLASTGATGLHVEQSDAEVARTAFTNLLGNDDEQSLSERLIDATKRGATTEGPALAQEFAALFYLHSATVADFKPILRGARADSIPFEVLAAAFQEADTPPAQAALAEIAEQRAGEPHTDTALAVGMGFIQHPSVAIDGALAYVSEHGDSDAAGSAELALGSIAGRLLGVDNQRAAAIIAHIKSRLAAAKDDYAKHTELLALGNARAAGSTQEILALASDPSSDVRSAVATALRYSDDPAADDALRGLLSDQGEDVRLAAATAFDSRTPSGQSFAALVSVMQHDPSASVRAGAVQAVWAARGAFPKAESMVRAAAHDSDANVRSVAEQALAAQHATRKRPIPPDITALTR